MHALLLHRRVPSSHVTLQLSTLRSVEHTEQTHFESESQRLAIVKDCICLLLVCLFDFASLDPTSVFISSGNSSTKLPRRI